MSVSPSLYRDHRLRLWKDEAERQRDVKREDKSRDAMGNVDLHFLPSGAVRTVTAGMTALDILKRFPNLFPNIDPYIALFNEKPVCLQSPITEQGVLEIRGKPSPASDPARDQLSGWKPDPFVHGALWHSTSHLLGAAMELKYGDEVLLTSGSRPFPSEAFSNPSGVDSILLLSAGFHYTAVLKRTLPLNIHASLSRLDTTIETETWLSSSDIASRIRNMLFANTSDLFSVRESSGDLDHLVQLARDLAGRKLPFERMSVPRNIAARMFAYNPFKLYFIATNTGPEDAITLYKTGEFIDLCRGPHIHNSIQVSGGIELESVSGARWEPALTDPEAPEGVESAQPLARVSGISFVDQAHAVARADLVRKARERDHRVVGKQQELFMFHKSSPGIPFMLPRGVRIVERLKTLMRDEYATGNYDEVVTPLVFGKEIWETSGHWENYREDMFVVSGAGESDTSHVQCQHGHDDSHAHAHVHGASATPAEGVQGLKPMNCPGHCLVFANQARSYRELPIRLAEFSPLHRNEASGALTGLTRVRAFHQDDAHIFCRPSQILTEISATLALISSTYDKLGFSQYDFVLSTRPAKSMGTREQWDEAEWDLSEALNRAGKPWTMNPADGAFYGPKIDVHVTDALGRRHQTATVQLDFQLPLRFGLHYANEDGGREVPVIVHRAVLGSVERMMAILCEHYGGKWPFWLSPRQAVVATVGNDARTVAHAESVVKALRHGITSSGRGHHVDLDASDSTVGKKVRSAQVAQYNFALVVGKKEVEKGTVSVRGRDGENLGEKTVESLLSMFRELEDNYK